VSSIHHDDFEEGLAYLVPTEHIIGAVVLGAASVLAGFGWWLHHTFVTPTRRRTP